MIEENNGVLPAEWVKKIQKDTEVTEDNMASKSLEVSSLYTKYLDVYMKEYKRYKELLMKKDFAFKNKYHYYRFDFNFTLKTQAEITAYVNADIEYAEIQKKCDVKEAQLKYLEKVLETIKNIPFNIKNYIEFKKYMSGGF